MKRQKSILAEAKSLLADGQWHGVDELVVGLKDFVDAKRATQRYATWFKIMGRPIEVKIAMGRRVVIMDRLNTWKRKGLLEADDKPGVNRSYRLNNKE